MQNTIMPIAIIDEKNPTTIEAIQSSVLSNLTAETTQTTKNKTIKAFVKIMFIYLPLKRKFQNMCNNINCPTIAN